jgi:hypothetical protein
VWCRPGLPPTKSHGCRDFYTSSCKRKRETALREEEAADLVTHSVNRVPFLEIGPRARDTYVEFFAWSRFILRDGAGKSILTASEDPCDGTTDAIAITSVPRASLTAHCG